MKLTNDGIKRFLERKLDIEVTDLKIENTLKFMNATLKITEQEILAIRFNGIKTNEEEMDKLGISKHTIASKLNTIYDNFNESVIEYINSGLCLKDYIIDKGIDLNLIFLGLDNRLYSKKLISRGVCTIRDLCGVIDKRIKVNSVGVKTIESIGSVFPVNQFITQEVLTSYIELIYPISKTNENLFKSSTGGRPIDELIEELKIDPAKIRKYRTIPHELMNRFVRMDDGTHTKYFIEYLYSPPLDIQIAAVNTIPECISKIVNPNKEVQMAAINRNPLVIYLINKPHKTVMCRVMELLLEQGIIESLHLKGDN